MIHRAMLKTFAASLIIIAGGLCPLSAWAEMPEGKASDVLVRFDIAAETFQSWPIKSGNVYVGILRNARITPHGTLLMHQTATNPVIEVTPQKR
jgi:hypothetical protein